MQAYWRRLLILLVLSVVAHHPLSTAAIAFSEEDQIKVAFLYHFAKFVTWPETAFGGNNSEVTLCFFGESPLKDAVSSLHGKAIKGHALRVEHRSGTSNITACHIVFIEGSNQQLHQQMLTATQSAPILTIGDNIKHFTQNGGILNVISSERKVQFEISESAAERAGLKISAQLLELRIRVDARLP